MEDISQTELKRLHKYMKEINELEGHHEETLSTLQDSYNDFVNNLKVYKEYEASKQARLRSDYEKIVRKHQKILQLYQKYNALRDNKTKSVHNFSEFGDCLDDDQLNT